MRLRLLVILAAAFSLANAAHAADFVPGRVLVKYRSAAAARLHSTREVFTRTIAADRALVATAPTREATLAAVAALNADPDVEYAEPDYIRTRYGTAYNPKDALFKQQWGLPMVKAPDAWGDNFRGAGAITVAIIDTGWVPHPQLADRVYADQPGYDFISDPANAHDGDGRDGDPTDTGDSTDQSSALHGTHVAGIIAAKTDDPDGTAGIDWNCHILVVRALGTSHGTGVDSDIADAIRWSAGIHVDGAPDNAHPADVINMSFGGNGYSQTMQDAIHDAIAAGSIVVAAAGNLAIDAKGDSPAGLDGVITVGAVDQSRQRASYSNYGSVVALMAPGGSPNRDAMGAPMGVLSTIELIGSGFTYTYYAGTSQATPFVSGAVSLMRAVHPHMKAAEAKRILMATADPSSQCANPDDPTLDGCGAGLLDVDAAVVMAQAAGDDPIDPRTGNIVHGGYGCAVGGDSSPAGAIVMLLAALALLARRRRVL